MEDMRSSPLDRLSERQRQTLALMAEGRTYHELAAEFEVSFLQVKEEVSELLAVLGVDSREAAVALFRDAGRPESAHQRDMLHGNRAFSAALQLFGVVATVVFASVAVFALLDARPSDFRPAAAEVIEPATATPSPTRDPAIPTRRPRITPTIDIPGTIAARRPAPPVDQAGWPIVRCGEGTTVQKLTNRRITLCLPEGWSYSEMESSDPNQGVFSETVRLGPPGARTAAIEILFITRRSAMNTEVLEPVCAQRTDGSVVLGLKALRCDATWEAPNRMPIHPSFGWTSTLFVETPGDWVLAELTGLEREPGAIEAARANLLAILGRAVENGCQSPTPSMC